MHIVQIPITSIRVPEGGSAVDPSQLRELVKSIRETGLLQPIVVRTLPDVDGQAGNYELLAGRYRYRACESLGHKEISASIVELEDAQAELVAIDENLMRSELSGIERSEALLRRQQLYELLHPDTAAGVAGGKARHGSATDKLSFADDTAQAVGTTTRTMQRELRRAKKIPGDLKAKICGTSLDKGTELDEIAKDPERARPIIERAARGEQVSMREIVPQSPEAAQFRLELNRLQPVVSENLKRLAHEYYAEQMAKAGDFERLVVEHADEGFDQLPMFRSQVFVREIAVRLAKSHLAEISRLVEPIDIFEVPNGEPMPGVFKEMEPSAAPEA